MHGFVCFLHTQRATAHGIAHVLCMAFVWSLNTNCMQHCGSCTQVLQFPLTNTIPICYNVTAEYGLSNFRDDHGCTLLLHCATAHAKGRVQGILECAAYDYNRTMLMLQLVYHAWLCVGPAVIHGLQQGLVCKAATTATHWLPHESNEATSCTQAVECAAAPLHLQEPHNALQCTRAAA